MSDVHVIRSNEPDALTMIGSAGHIYCLAGGDWQATTEGWRFDIDRLWAKGLLVAYRSREEPRILTPTGMIFADGRTEPLPTIPFPIGRAD